MIVFYYFNVVNIIVVKTTVSELRYLLMYMFGEVVNFDFR